MSTGIMIAGPCSEAEKARLGKSSRKNWDFRILMWTIIFGRKTRARHTLRCIQRRKR